MTKEMVKALVEAANAAIDNYMKYQLPVDLGYEVGRTEFPIEDWFRAQKLIEEQGFYKKNYELLKTLRAAGFDVKMNMQTNKLVF
jgi:hypothetical protein